MTIKQRLPWRLRIIFIFAFVVFGSAMMMWVYHLGGDFTGTNIRGMRDKLQALSGQVDELKSENARLSGVVDSGESQLNMAQASRDQLATQIKSLEAENVKLKEDLTFFDSLLPTNIGTQGITLQRVQVNKISTNQLRYRLLVMQGQRSANDFNGQLTLDVGVNKNGKSQVLHFPAGASDAENARFKLSFKYYQRIDGILTLPEGATAKSVVVKVLFNGQVRAQQTVNL